MSYKTLFRLNTPRPWPGDVYQTSDTMGTPIRAPKQQYKPLQQPDFAQLLSKWVNTIHAFLKLSYKTSVHLNPPCLWPGDLYRPSVTTRALKRQCISLLQLNFLILMTAYKASFGPTKAPAKSSCGITFRIKGRSEPRRIGSPLTEVGTGVSRSKV